MNRVTLQAWAEGNLGIEPTPCYRTLLRWLHSDLIYPRPVKVGKSYYVDPDAVYVDAGDTDAIVRYHQRKQQHAA